METGRSPSPFPWVEVMHAGLCLLRLEPTIFWAMTPLEFHMMAGGLAKARGGLARPALEDMMRQFPDERQELRMGDGQ